MCEMQVFLLPKAGFFDVFIPLPYKKLRFFMRRSFFMLIKQAGAAKAAPAANRKEVFENILCSCQMKRPAL